MVLSAKFTGTGGNVLVSDVCFRSLEDVVRAMPEWVKLDVAIEVMAEVLSDQRRAIANEEKKEKPDREKLERLKAEKRKLLQERQDRKSVV